MHVKVRFDYLEVAMIRISILYPNVKGSRFDFEYYVQKHMPRSIQLLTLILASEVSP